MPLIFDWIPHCCSFPELGPLTQTDLLSSLWLHINMTKRTNRIRDLTRYRVFWGFPLGTSGTSYNAHMLSIDYQKIVKSIRLSSIKLAPLAYWTTLIKTASTIEPGNWITRFVTATNWRDSVQAIASQPPNPHWKASPNFTLQVGCVSLHPLGVAGHKAASSPNPCR